MQASRQAGRERLMKEGDNSGWWGFNPRNAFNSTVINLHLNIITIILLIRWIDWLIALFCLSISFIIYHCQWLSILDWDYRPKKKYWTETEQWVVMQQQQLEHASSSIICIGKQATKSERKCICWLSDWRRIVVLSFIYRELSLMIPNSMREGLVVYCQGIYKDEAKLLMYISNHNLFLLFIFFGGWVALY